MVNRDEQRLLLAFYGDDFTGTTATAEALTESGVPTVIFTEPPSAAFLAEHFPRVRAVGVAGTARTLTVAEMEETLPPLFEILGSYRPLIFLYKVCSTFDSAENIGSIGRAIEIGRRIFSPEIVPILPAATKFGRYTVFGNHFAALGPESVHRLDRHPSISRHPVTPMLEADLRLHLAAQTTLPSGLIDVLDLEKGRAHVQALLDEFVAASTPLVLFDCLYERHLLLACEAIWKRAVPEKPVFFVGSQELGYGFGAVWWKSGLLSPTEISSDERNPSDKGPLLVLSGSCATVTGQQIRWALKDGFANIEIEPQQLLSADDRLVEQERVIHAALVALQQGQSAVVHTAIGPTDLRTEAFEKKIADLSLTPARANEILGNALGEIALKILQLFPLRRLVLAGGDTSGRIQKHLGIQALQVAKPIGLAAPLCYVYSSIPGLNGLEMGFKGGQVGAIDYFVQAQSACTLDFEVNALGGF